MAVAGPARVVVQARVAPDSYLVQTRSGRYAVFAQSVVDLTLRRVSRTDLEGVVAVPAEGDQVYRARDDGTLELLDLRTGHVRGVAKEDADAVSRRAPEQRWSAHEGMLSNEALPQLSPETRATASALEHVEPAIVLDIDERGERVLTATAARICLWSMTLLARETCAPRAHQNYALRADGTMRVWQVTADGKEQWGTLSALDAEVRWDVGETRVDARPPSLQQPCGLALHAGPSENVFARAGHALFTLHDFGPDGWAIVLPDGRYIADQAPPRGLAFFEADGSLCSSERVRALHQAQAARAAVHAGATGACRF